MASRDEGARRVCIQHRMLDDERLAFSRKHGVDVYCWTVDDAGKARRLVERGVDGIISNDLALFEALS